MMVFNSVKSPAVLQSGGKPSTTASWMQAGLGSVGLSWAWLSCRLQVGLGSVWEAWLSIQLQHLGCRLVWLSHMCWCLTMRCRLNMLL